jgi:hypothetical protein
MKGKTCCRVHQYLEDVPCGPDYLTELLANLRFVLKNQGEFARQEKRLDMYALCDKFVDDPKTLYTHRLVRWKLAEVEHYLSANGHGPINPDV